MKRLKLRGWAELNRGAARPRLGWPIVARPGAPSGASVRTAWPRFARTLVALLTGLAALAAHAQTPSMLDAPTTALVAGTDHNCALDTMGGVRCWGYNNHGQLGDQSNATRSTPVAVVDDSNTPIGGVVDIAAGSVHTCVVTAAGGALCWGYNGQGQLGDNTTTTRSTPVAVVDESNTPISGIVSVAGGSFHTCALTTAGGVICWGNNSFYGQLGDGTHTDHLTPVAVVDETSTPIRGVVAIAANDGHSCALDKAGGVRCWGYNSHGQLGDNSTTNRNTAVAVVDATNTPIGDVVAIAAGDLHTCASDSTGGMRCWGYNHYGQLGDNSTTNRRTAVAVVDATGTPIGGVVAIAAGGDHTCAVDATGSVRCWGDNSQGQIGDNTTADRITPVAVVDSGGTPIDNVVAIALGAFHSCALDSTGGLRCWGYGDFGELGNGTMGDRRTPVPVSGLSSGAAAIAADFFHTCALTPAGGVKCWGSNDNGQLGDGTTTNRSMPVDVSGLTHGVTAIAPGGFYTCALTTAGGVKCWGDNSFGQLGDGTTVDRSTPVTVVDGSNTPISDVVAITAGAYHTCALNSAGGVRCWGRNDDGQLGNSTWTDSSTPVNVSGLSQFVAEISAGALHTCARGTPGWVICWGHNGNGQLGDNSTADRSTGVVVVDSSGTAIGDVAAISAGGYHTCALGEAGGVRCWGNNGDGALGDNSTTDRLTPVAVVDASNDPITGIAAIAAGLWHSCALGTAGDVRCWGQNDTGQLGDNSTTNRLTPVAVVDSTNTTIGGVAAIATGGFHTCALGPAAGLRCWGYNTNGQLGNDTTVSQLVPVAIRTGQSIDFAPPATMPVTGNLTLSATASGGGTVPIGFDTWTPDTCTVSGNIVTATGLGLCGVRASRTGGSDGDSGTLAAAPQQLRLVRIIRATPILTVASDSEPAVYGQTVTFTANLSGAVAPTGDVSFCADATTTDATCSGGTLLCTVVASASPIQCTTASLDVGTHAISAYFAGDAGNSAATSAPLTQHVDSAATTTSVSAPGPITLGEPVTITATVAVIAPGAGTPTGFIDVSDGEVNCTIILPATTCGLVPESVGTRTVTATYLGDLHFNTSFGTTDLTVDPPPTLVIVSGSQQETPVNTAFALPLTVQVLDSQGEPLANIEIAFDAPTGGPGAVLSATSVTTGADGVASITATANNQVGSYEVLASSAGIEDVAFDLTNTQAPGALDVGIDDGRAFGQYGQTLDYLVTIHNAGPGVAEHVSVDMTLAPQLDAAFTTWICVDADAPGVTCTASGDGALGDSEVTVPADASVTWLVSAPIRLDAPGETVDTILTVTSPDQALAPVGDTTTLVIFRNGLDTADDDGANGAVLTPLAEMLEPGKVWQLELPADSGGDSIVATELVAHGDTNANFRIERLRVANGEWLRLVQHDASGAEYPWPWVYQGWVRRDHAAPIELLLAEDDANRSVLHLAGIADPILGDVGERPTYRVRVADGVLVATSP